MDEKLTGKRILIVDDLSINLQILYQILRNICKISFAKSGPIAIEIARKIKPDLILLDVVMPEMSGFEVCKILKSDNRTKDIPIIFNTSLDKEQNEIMGFDLGAVDYITKPFEHLVVEARVRLHLELKIHRDNLDEIVQLRTNELKKKNIQFKSHIVERIKAENEIRRIKEGYRSFARVGLALSVEKNTKKLLEMIVEQARKISLADAGTLYLIDKDRKFLSFEIIQNDSMNIRMGGVSGTKIPFENVPLYIDGKPNYSNVSSYVALKGNKVNIENVYEAEGFDFSGTRAYDSNSGYHSVSMIVIPMKNYDNEIIGVLQLLNAQNFDNGKIIPFSKGFEDLIESLASQAAVALTNTELNKNLNDLFNAFIKSIATAIDEMSPYTGGHIRRVVEITTLIADGINKSENEHFKDVKFNDDELEELRLAAWMHDIGKITTPQFVIDKATKLDGFYDAFTLIETRFELIEKIIENSYLSRKINLLQKTTYNSSIITELNEHYMNEKKILKGELDFLKSCVYSCDFMTDEMIERVKQISRKTFVKNDKEYNYLKPDEIKKISIRKGTLTGEERQIVENHVFMTMKMLKQLPFPKRLANVPEYASCHHEKLDGSGYHQGIAKDKLLIQSRIIAIADIFEALTAKDRPYRKPMKLSQAVKIMGFMKKDLHIDSNIFDLLIENNIYKEYVNKELSSDQIDNVQKSQNG